MRKQLSFLFPKGSKSDSVLPYVGPAHVFTVKLSEKDTHPKNPCLHHISCLVTKLRHVAALDSDYVFRYDTYCQYFERIVQLC